MPGPDHGLPGTSNFAVRNTRHSRSAAPLASRRAACAEARRSSVRLLVLRRVAGGLGFKVYAPGRWAVGGRDAPRRGPGDAEAEQPTLGADESPSGKGDTFPSPEVGRISPPFSASWQRCSLAAVSAITFPLSLGCRRKCRPSRHSAGAGTTHRCCIDPGAGGSLLGGIAYRSH